MQTAANFQNRTLYRELNSVPSETLVISSLHLISKSSLILAGRALLRLARRHTSVQYSRWPLVRLYTKLFLSLFSAEPP